MYSVHMATTQNTTNIPTAEMIPGHTYIDQADGVPFTPLTVIRDRFTVWVEIAKPVHDSPTSWNTYGSHYHGVRPAGQIN